MPIETISDKEQLSAMPRIKRIHFVGIGGVGMSGIAEVLHNQGYLVSGSDLNDSPSTARLKQLGVKIYIGHQNNNVDDVDVVVISSAVTQDNPELIAAKEQRIPVISRAEMLAELMRFKHGIAVAGTHGKTTTTSLVASMLGEGKLDPTFVIGGKLNSAGSNAKLGSGEYLVAEADESDASFLQLKPMMAIVTNIDHDHMSTYQGNISTLRQTFLDFLHHLPFYGLAVLCIDDENVQAIVTDIKRPFVTYGFSAKADLQVLNFKQDGLRCSFVVKDNLRAEQFECQLNLPGKHNALNAVAAVAIAREVGVAPADIRQAMKGFEGIARRFNVYDEVATGNGPVTVIDDYGHHPAEVKATIDAIRQVWPERRLVTIFQPHRYSRTRDLFEDFVSVLSQTDQLLLMDVYPAGEDVIAGADGRSLCRAIRQRAQVEPIFVDQKEKLLPLAANVLKENDVVLMQGAGNIGQLAQHVINKGFKH